MIKAVVCRSYHDSVAMEKNPQDLFISALDPSMIHEALIPSDKVILFNWGDCGGWHNISIDCGNFPSCDTSKVIEFLKKWQDDPTPRILNVNCFAGRSRSGAIGTFTWQYLGLDFFDFISKSPQVNPNQHLLKELWNQAGGTPSTACSTCGGNGGRSWGTPSPGWEVCPTCRVEPFNCGRGSNPTT